MDKAITEEQKHFIKAALQQDKTIKKDDVVTIKGLDYRVLTAGNKEVRLRRL